jgi:hypothetical protein
MIQSIPNFHDGYVTGLKVREGGATLYLRQVDGADFNMILEDLEALQIDDFRQGNIISHVDIIAGRLLSANALDRLYEPPHPAAAPQYHEKYASFLKGQVERIERGEAQLLVTVPSYGADLLAICRQVHCVAA